MEHLTLNGRQTLLRISYSFVSVSLVAISILDDVSFTAAGSTTNLIANGSFDDTILKDWGKPSWHAYRRR